MRAHSDDLACQVVYAGQPAHTTNDSYVWIPDHVWISDRSVLIAGEPLFNGGTPSLMTGSITGAITVSEDRLAPLGAQTIVPGRPST